MQKPEKETRVAYDYYDCRDYLAAKHGILEGSRDWEWWHFVCDKAAPGRRGYFTMHEEWADDIEPWQESILRLFLTEFGEDGKIEFYVDW